MPPKLLQKYIKAACNADWQQVVLNGGPPCFHLEKDGSFCFRAERWHEYSHDYVPLQEVLENFVQRTPPAKPAEPLRSLPDQERPANYRCEKDGTCPCEGLCRRDMAWRDLTEAERERLMAKPAEPRK